MKHLSISSQLVKLMRNNCKSTQLKFLIIVYLLTNSINRNKILNIIAFHNKFIKNYFLINKILAIQNNLLQKSFFKTINIKELFLKAWHLNYNFKMWNYC